MINTRYGLDSEQMNLIPKNDFELTGSYILFLLLSMNLVNENCVYDSEIYT